MKKTLRTVSLAGVASLLAVTAYQLPSQADEHEGDGERSTHEFSLFGVADLHGFIMPYDYRTNEHEDHGIAQLHTLIKELEDKHPNNLIVDNGDFIQGSDLAEYEAVTNPIDTTEEKTTTVKAMEAMGVDVSVVGNHEFNFGLDFLQDTIDTADFPILAANVYDEGTDELTYDPYLMMEQEVDGRTLKVGVIGLTPPGSMQFDGFFLQGNVYIEDIVTSAEKYVPKMKEKGADIIVANAHSGIDEGFETGDDNAATELAKVDGIDALLLGHQHSDFPGASRYDDIEGVDNENGLIHGVPATMPNRYGTKAGVIDFELAYEDGEWEILGSEQTLHDARGKEASPEIVDVAEEVHEDVIAFYAEEVGEFEAPITGYFSRVTDTALTQVINDAQMWYTENVMAGTDYEDLPIVSAAAPFSSTVDVAANETLTRADMSAVYRFPNTLQVAKIDGGQLHDWLETSAGNFNQIDPEETGEQSLLSGFPGFDFDIIDGVEYQIDITEPVGERITDLTLDGQPVDPDQEMLIATNNYRAGGSGGHVDLNLQEDIVVELNTLNRDAIMAYLDETGSVDPSANHNWSIKEVDTKGPVTFSASSDGAPFLDELGLDFVTHEGGGDYTIDLSRTASLKETLPETAFSDFNETHRGFDDVLPLIERSVILGYPDETFRPHNEITRTEAAIMMARMFDLDAVESADGGFDDVSENHPQFGYIQAVKEAGIFEGDLHNQFHPDEDITRGETAAILTRAFDLAHENGTETPYTDVPDTFKEAIGTLYHLEITEGYTETEFGTERAVTRRDFAILSTRADQIQ